MFLQITPDTYSNPDFHQKLNKIVWCEYLDIKHFETEWKNLLTEYNLIGNKWLNDMFEMRHKWVPAYFNDVHMSGLMRTTSRSESQNSFFGTFSHSESNLIEFMLRFDSAMNKQRHSKRELDNENFTKVPMLKTRLDIEVHARNIFTSSVFYDLQEEMDAAVWTCDRNNISKTNDGVVCCDVVDHKKGTNGNANFKVRFNVM